MSSLVCSSLVWCLSLNYSTSSVLNLQSFFLQYLDCSEVGEITLLLLFLLYCYIFLALCHSLYFKGMCCPSNRFYLYFITSFILAEVVIHNVCKPQFCLVWKTNMWPAIIFSQSQPRRLSCSIKLQTIMCILCKCTATFVN